jgi:flagellin-specific chaperone FliS
VFASQTLIAEAATLPTIRDEQQVTRLGSQLLQDANRADKALEKNNIPAANRDIDQALADRSKLAQQAKAVGDSMIVPLYADLDDTEYLSTVGRGSRTNGAASANSAASQGAPLSVTVKSNVGQVTYLAIDLDKTSSRLRAAKIAIQNKNEQAAEDSLAAVGSNLVATSVSTDLPLLTTREDLALARSAVNAKDYQAATVDLHEASKALTAYAASGPHAEDARRLSAEIGAAPSSVSTQNVDSWWERVKDWFAHPSV